VIGDIAEIRPQFGGHSGISTPTESPGDLHHRRDGSTDLKVFALEFIDLLCVIRSDRGEDRLFNAGDVRGHFIDDVEVLVHCVVQYGVQNRDRTELQ